MPYQLRNNVSSRITRNIRSVPALFTKNNLFNAGLRPRGDMYFRHTTSAINNSRSGSFGKRDRPRSGPGSLSLLSYISAFLGIT